MKPRLWPLVAMLLLGGGSLATARTWTNTEGRKLEATFVRLHEGNVILLKGNKPVSVALSQFSPEDQEYVRQQVAKKGKSQALEPSEEKPAPRKEKSADEAPVRTWRDIHGNQTTASLAGVSGGNVILVEKGKRRLCPFFGFCAADQEYIRKELAAKGQGHLLPPGMAMPAEPNIPVPPPRAGPSRPMPTPRRPSLPSRPDFRQPEPVRPSVPRPSPRPSIPRPSPPSYRPPPSRVPSVPSMPSIPSPSPRIRMPRADFSPTTYGKQCGSCRKPVPDHCTAGDTCPHCGVRWDFEEGPGGKRKYDPRYVLYSVAGVGVMLLLALIGWLKRS